MFSIQRLTRAAHETHGVNAELQIWSFLNIYESADIIPHGCPILDTQWYKQNTTTKSLFSSIVSN